MITGEYTCTDSEKVLEIVVNMGRSRKYFLASEFPELPDVQPMTWEFHPTGFSYFIGIDERPTIKIDREGNIYITAETAYQVENEMRRLIERTGIGEIPRQEIPGFGVVGRHSIINKGRIFPSDLEKELVA